MKTKQRETLIINGAAKTYKSNRTIILLGILYACANMASGEPGEHPQIVACEPEYPAVFDKFYLDAYGDYMKEQKDNRMTKLKHKVGWDNYVTFGVGITAKDKPAKYTSWNDYADKDIKYYGRYLLRAFNQSGEFGSYNPSDTDNIYSKENNNTAIKTYSFKLIYSRPSRINVLGKKDTILKDTWKFYKNPKTPQHPTDWIVEVIRDKDQTLTTKNPFTMPMICRTEIPPIYTAPPLPAVEDKDDIVKKVTCNFNQEVQKQLEKVTAEYGVKNVPENFGWNISSERTIKSRPDAFNLGWGYRADTPDGGSRFTGEGITLRRSVSDKEYLEKDNFIKLSNYEFNPYFAPYNVFNIGYNTTDSIKRLPQKPLLDKWIFSPNTIVSENQSMPYQVWDDEVAEKIKIDQNNGQWTLRIIRDKSLNKSNKDLSFPLDCREDVTINTYYYIDHAKTVDGSMYKYYTEASSRLSWDFTYYIYYYPNSSVGYKFDFVSNRTIDFFNSNWFSHDFLDDELAKKSTVEEKKG